MTEPSAHDPRVRHTPPSGPLNERWPEVIPPAAPAPIPVTARLAWPDGTITVDTRALRWTREHVLVAVLDPRLAGRWAVWLPARDVTRR